MIAIYSSAHTVYTSAFNSYYHPKLVQEDNIVDAPLDQRTRTTKLQQEQEALHNSAKELTY